MLRRPVDRADAPAQGLCARQAEQVPVPVFLFVPAYLCLDEAVRRAAGDTFDYTAVCRYSVNSGWAAGATPTEAAVHAVNEVIERDAMSLLLIEQFLRPCPPPLRVVDPTTLPAALFALHTRAQERVGGPVSLLEMTTDIGVPAYWAHTPADTPGSPARLRGCGA
ncbi:YcaO-like family protein [Streptomyces anulatus]|uniref:YcaO-like family protein n=1 Tax=Streptomyces anulatus TaxID=1892 RepID=UPI003B7AD644